MSCYAYDIELDSGEALSGFLYFAALPVVELDKLMTELQAEVLTRTESKFRLIRIESVSGCSGCRENQANQLAHCDYGGCLYLSEDEGNDSM